LTAKKSPIACDDRALKANSNKMHAPYGAIAFELQTAGLQAAHLARRFQLSPHVAAAVASLAFGEARR
jgi:hypothetical protein